MTRLAQVVDFEQARAKRSAREGERWVGKRDVARHFGVSVRTVENWMKQGLPHRKRFANSPVRFRLSACDDWFEGGTGR